MEDDKAQWLDSRQLRDWLMGRRTNDVKVEINGIYVPLTAVHYDSAADVYVLTPYRGHDLRIALTTGEPDD